MDLNSLGIKYFTLDKSIQILVILMGTIIVNFIVRKYLNHSQRLDTKRAKTLLSLAQSLISIIIFVLGIALILSVLDIDITPLLAGAGIVGIAVGFGSQALVKDLIAGLFLLAEDSIAVGDLVEIGKDRGIVRRISLRTIVLKDDTGALHIIPAGQITSLVNLSREDANVSIDIPFKSTTPIEKVYKSIREEIRFLMEDKRFSKMLIKKPELKGIETIEAGKVIVRTVLYCKAQDQWRVKREFLYRLKKRFEKEKLELA